MDIQRAAKKIAQAKHLVISTGAGVSAESGVPTFRDALDGLWAKYDPQMLATPQAFRANPKLVWDWYWYRRELVEKTRPNPGHYAIAALEKLLPEVTLITQNVDHHHQQAGNKNIITLHGSLFAYKCANNCQGEPTSVEVSRLTWKPEDAPPTCPYCGKGKVRPDVVWFGEALPEANLRRAFELARTCDVMLLVGTSNVVYPAARLPIEALYQGAFVIEINSNPTDLTPRMSVFLQGKSGDILPQLVEAVREELGAE
ncbi:MAG: NAD-dependent deacylase [Anaerolineae bacterium]|nr:NAD-dependent deacylase [Anaerolineae bacterium]